MYGNIVEAMPRQSVYSLLQMISQIAAAMEYLESIGLVHTRIVASSVFVVAPGKVQVDGNVLKIIITLMLLHLVGYSWFSELIIDNECLFELFRDLHLHSLAGIRRGNQ